MDPGRFELPISRMQTGCSTTELQALKEILVERTNLPVNSTFLQRLNSEGIYYVVGAEGIESQYYSKAEYGTSPSTRAPY